MTSPQVARFMQSRAEPHTDAAHSMTPFSQQDPAEPVKVVWGTAVEIQGVIADFKEFLLNFKQKYRIAAENEGFTEFTESQNQPFYPQLLEQV